MAKWFLTPVSLGFNGNYNYSSWGLESNFSFFMGGGNLVATLQATVVCVFRDGMASRKGWSV